MDYFKVIYLKEVNKTIRISVRTVRVPTGIQIGQLLSTDMLEASCYIITLNFGCFGPVKIFPGVHWSPELV
jgi:hypothetical protein